MHIEHKRDGDRVCMDINSFLDDPGSVLHGLLMQYPIVSTTTRLDMESRLFQLVWKKGLTRTASKKDIYQLDLGNRMNVPFANRYLISPHVVHRNKISQ